MNVRRMKIYASTDVPIQLADIDANVHEAFKLMIIINVSVSGNICLCFMKYLKTNKTFYLIIITIYTHTHTLHKCFVNSFVF